MRAVVAVRLRTLAAAAAVTGAMALGAAPAAAVQCGDEITEDTKLHRDLKCDGTTNGLEIGPGAIGTDDVTLDLNGHTISAQPNAASAIGVFVGHGTGNVVTGGRIRGFDVGAVAGESTKATISHLDIRASASQIAVSESIGTRVLHNLLRNGAGSALFVDGQFTEDVKVVSNEVRGGAIALNEVEGVLAADNVVRDSDGAGISAGNVDQAVVRDNHVDTANEAGIAIGGAAGEVLVADNKVAGTKGGGIVTSTGAGPVRVLSNTVLDVNFNGFFVSGGTDVKLRRNVAKRSQGGDGIHVEDADTLIEDNRVIENDQHGIESLSSNGDGNIAKRNGVHPQCMPQSLCGTGKRAPARRRALECGDTITADRTLKHDLQCDPGEGGITIGANGVKLDLDGHEIAGNDSTMATAGVSLSGRADAVVRGGTIRGFGLGIDAGALANLTATHLVIRHVEYYPVRLTAYNGATVVENTLRGSGLDGVFSNGSEGITVADNLMTHGGITFSMGSEQRVIGNSIDETGGFGLSARSGVDLDSVEGAVIRDNLIEDAASAAVEVGGSSTGVVVNGNTVRRSDSNNIWVASTATGVTVKLNQVRGAGNNGILVENNAGAEVRRNDVRGAAVDGIQNSEDTTPVVHNTANANTGYGIDTVSGPLSHDNVAKHNGNPEQCNPAEACTT